MDFVTVRSSNFGPRTPGAEPWWMWAMVALLFSPSKVPLTVNLVPVRVAVAEPVPAMVDFIAASRATGARRVLKVSGLCAKALIESERTSARMGFRMT